MDTEKKHVFISYSRSDYKNEDKTIKPGNVISEIKKVFDAAHITYWIDEEGIYSGDEYVPVISKAIKMCDVFLFVSSQSSNASEWTSSEIAAARMYKKKIIPLRLDDSPYNDSIILYIAHLDFIDYRKNPQDALSSLVKSVQSYIETQKLEEERLKAELESQKRKKEEDQKRLIADIELQAEELENDEREAELKRRRLLQTVQNVEDESERNRLTELINSKGSIQRKYAQEINELKEKNDELKLKNGELNEENHELKKENAILEVGNKAIDPQTILVKRPFYPSLGWLPVLGCLVVGFILGFGIAAIIFPSHQQLAQKQYEIERYAVSMATMQAEKDSLLAYKEKQERLAEEAREIVDSIYLSSNGTWEKSKLQSKKYIEYFEHVLKGDLEYLCHETEIRPTNHYWEYVLRKCSLILESKSSYKESALERIQKNFDGLEDRIDIYHLYNTASDIHYW